MSVVDRFGVGLLDRAQGIRIILDSMVVIIAYIDKKSCLYLFKVVLHSDFYFYHFVVVIAMHNNSCVIYVQVWQI